MAITLRVNGDLALGDFVFIHRLTRSETLPAAYFVDDRRAKLDDEEDVLYKLKLHTFDQQVSSTEAEEMYTYMLFPFLRISGLLRFLNDGRRPLIMDAQILRILEAVVLEPALVHGKESGEAQALLPTSFSKLATAEGNALVMELRYDSDEVVHGLHGLLEYALQVLSPDSVDKVMRVFVLCATVVGFMKQYEIREEETEVETLLVGSGLPAIEVMVTHAIAMKELKTLVMVCKAGLDVLSHLDVDMIRSRARQAMRWMVFASSADDQFHCALLFRNACMVGGALDEEDVKALAEEVLAFRGYASVEGSRWTRKEGSLVFVNGALVFNCLTASLDTATASFSTFPKAIVEHTDCPKQLTSTCLKLRENHVEFSPKGQEGMNLRLNLDSGMAVKRVVGAVQSKETVAFKGVEWKKNAALWDVLKADAFARGEAFVVEFRANGYSADETLWATAGMCSMCSPSTKGSRLCTSR